MTVTDSPLPADPAAAGDVPAFSDAQIVEIAKAMTPLIEEAMKAAIDAAVSSTPVPVFRPGTVSGFNADTITVTVTVDGDSSPITASVAGEWPMPGDRVLMLFAPGGTVWCVQILGRGGVPAGAVLAYLGPITVDTPGSAAASAPPPGFARPYGQIGTQGQYPGLFHAIGSTYNTGTEDAQLGQFRFPDCRGLIMIGLDNMGGSDRGKHALANSVGTVGGQNTISDSMLPPHTHSIDHTHGSSSVSGSVGGSDGTHTHNDNGHTHPNGWGTTYVLNGGGSSYPAAGSDSASSTGTGYASINSTGSGHGHGFSLTAAGQSHSGNSGNGPGSSAEHLPPVMVCNWIIKVA